MISVATKIPMNLLDIYLWRYRAVSEVLALSFLVILKRVRGLVLSDYEYLANDFICLKPKSTWTSDLFKKRQSVQKLVNVPCINTFDTVFHRFFDHVHLVNPALRFQIGVARTPVCVRPRLKVHVQHWSFARSWNPKLNGPKGSNLTVIKCNHRVQS